jgi:hypothetical protein
MTDADGTSAGGNDSSGDEGKAFTQADVDRIVKERLVQQAKNKFGDYEELRSKAEGAKTLEERFATLESELNSTRAEAVRSKIAAEFGISTKKGPKGEPSDADLFLTGTDEAVLTAQAERLGAREADRQKQGNVAKNEGGTTSTGKSDEGMREAVRGLFGKPD